MVNGGFTIMRGISPLMVKRYTTTVLTIGARINGTARIGFITIGAPKIMGSLMLNRPGINDSLPSDFR